MAGKIIADFMFGAGQVITGLVNDLITGGTDKALTAEQGKVLNAVKANIANFIALKQPAGYLQIPTSGGGVVLIQWATMITANGALSTWTFPTAFPEGVRAFFGTPNGNVADSISPIINSTSATKTSVQVGATRNNAFVQYGVFFLAIGH